MNEKTSMVTVNLSDLEKRIQTTVEKAAKDACLAACYGADASAVGRIFLEKMQPFMGSLPNPWKVSEPEDWYFSTCEEGPYEGPFGTREEVLAEAADQGYDSVYIAQASKTPVDLAEWIGDLDDLVAAADDRLSESDRVTPEFDDEAIFQMTAEAAADLEKTVKAAIRGWQLGTGHLFTTNTFARMTTPEAVDLSAVSLTRNCSWVRAGVSGSWHCASCRAKVSMQNRPLACFRGYVKGA